INMTDEKDRLHSFERYIFERYVRQTRSGKGGNKRKISMRRAYNPLIPLIQTLDDGIEFYRVAEKKAESLHLKSTFRKMAEIRDFSLAYILPYIDHHDFDLDKSLTYHGTLATRYAPLLNRTVPETQLKLVWEAEEHLIDAMLSAAESSHNALVQCIIKDLIPRISLNFENCLQDQAA